MADNAKDPAFPFYAFDWLSSSTVTLMTLAEQGAFIRLLCHMWAANGCMLPDCKHALEKLSGWEDQVNRLQNTAMAGGPFDVEAECMGSFDTIYSTLNMAPDCPGFLTHQKLYTAWVYRQEEKQRQRDRTAAATAARRNDDRNDDRNDNRNVVHSNSNSNQENYVLSDHDHEFDQKDVDLGIAATRAAGVARKLAPKTKADRKLVWQAACASLSLSENWLMDAAEGVLQKSGNLKSKFAYFRTCLKNGAKTHDVGKLLKSAPPEPKAAVAGMPAVDVKKVEP